MATTFFPIKTLLSGSVTPGTIVSTRGWVKTRRDSKAGFSFISINDGSCFSTIQIVAPNSLDNYTSEILRLTAGCSVIITGELVKSPGEKQPVEIQAQSIQVVGWIDDPETYPISPKHHSLEYLREHAHLRARTNTIGAVTRVRHCVSQAVHRFFSENGFYWIHTPIITSSDCEGAGQLFKVSSLDFLNIPKKPDGSVDYSEDFFGKSTFLTVSGQLNAEAYCLALSKVYTFGPTFRAENSNTSKHLAEFWMIEPEVAFADLNEIASLSADMLVYVCKAVINELPDDMDFFEKHVNPDCLKRLHILIDKPFIEIEYKDAIDLLIKSNQKFEFPVAWGLDLQSEHERYLTEKILNSVVVVKNYPKEIKSFYMRVNDDGKTVAAMDVLAPGIGEIIGGSQREERLEILDQRMDEIGLNKSIYSWYRDLRRYGTVPHSGYGLGLERLLGFITGVTNVRDLIAFPRTPKHAEY